MLISDQKYYICSTDREELERMAGIIYLFLSKEPDHRSITVNIKVEGI